jgi:hypothetical protein
VAGAPGKFSVTANVKNVSAREGDEVVEVYASRGSTPEDPIRELCGMDRVHLLAGQARDVQFAVDLTTPLGAPDSASGAQATTAAGKITFSVGGGQPLPGAHFVESAVQP